MGQARWLAKCLIAVPLIIVSWTQFHVYILWGQCPYKFLNSVLNVKVLVGTFNQEKGLVGVFSVITNLWMNLRFKL